MTRIPHQKTRKTGKQQRGPLAMAIVGLVTATLISPTAASAGACKHTTRVTQRLATDGYPEMAVETVVRDETTDRSYVITIKRDDEIVKSGVIKPQGSDAVRIKNTSGSGKDSTYKVIIADADDMSITSTCNYQVSVGLKGTNATTTWELTDGASVPCSGNINLSCDKSYRDGSWTWKTTLVITD